MRCSMQASTPLGAATVCVPCVLKLMRSATAALGYCDAAELSAAAAAAVQTLDLLVAAGMTGDTCASAFLDCCCALQQRQQRQRDSDGAASEQQLGAALDTLLYWLQQQLQCNRLTWFLSAALLSLFNAAAARGSRQLLDSLAQRLHFRANYDSHMISALLSYAMRAPNSSLFPQLLQRLLGGSASRSQAGSPRWCQFCAAAAGALSELATIAAKEGRLQALEALLDAGAPIGICPVIAAASRQDLAPLRVLLGSAQPLPEPHTDGSTCNGPFYRPDVQYSACPIWHVLARSKVCFAVVAWLLHAACCAGGLSLALRACHACLIFCELATHVLQAVRQLSRYQRFFYLTESCALQAIELLATAGYRPSVFTNVGAAALRVVSASSRGAFSCTPPAGRPAVVGALGHALMSVQAFLWLTKGHCLAARPQVFMRGQRWARWDPAVHDPQIQVQGRHRRARGGFPELPQHLHLVALCCTAARLLLGHPRCLSSRAASLPLPPCAGCCGWQPTRTTANGPCHP